MSSIEIQEANFILLGEHLSSSLDLYSGLTTFRPEEDCPNWTKELVAALGAAFFPIGFFIAMLSHLLLKLIFLVIDYRDQRQSWSGDQIWIQCVWQNRRELGIGMLTRSLKLEYYANASFQTMESSRHTGIVGGVAETSWIEIQGTGCGYLMLCLARSARSSLLSSLKTSWLARIHTDTPKSHSNDDGLSPKVFHFQ